MTTKKLEIQPAEVCERPVDDGKTEYFLGHEYHVSDWRPGPPGSGPTTEVHLLIAVGPGAKVVMRLKSARALDVLVGVLLDYRKSVWPNEPAS